MLKYHMPALGARAVPLIAVLLAACDPNVPPATSVPATGPVKFRLGDVECTVQRFEVNFDAQYSRKTNTVYAAHCPGQSTTTTRRTPGKAVMPVITIDGQEYVAKESAK